MLMMIELEILPIACQEPQEVPIISLFGMMGMIFQYQYMWIIIGLKL